MLRKLPGPVSHLARLPSLYPPFSLVFHVSHARSAFKVLFFWDRQIPASLLESRGLALSQSSVLTPGLPGSDGGAWASLWRQLVSAGPGQPLAV